MSATRPKRSSNLNPCSAILAAVLGELRSAPGTPLGSTHCFGAQSQGPGDGRVVRHATIHTPLAVDPNRWQHAGRGRGGEQGWQHGAGGKKDPLAGCTSVNTAHNGIGASSSLLKVGFRWSRYGNPWSPASEYRRPLLATQCAGR